MSPFISLKVALERMDASGNRFLLDVETQFPAEGITVLYGPSGCGKTTLLRAIAGLEPLDSGLVQIGEEIWQDKTVCRPAHQRSLGYVFQEASLFDHLRVRGNLNYAYKRSAEQHPGFYQQVVSLLGLEAMLDRHPARLSGGERQRVAIARALLARPKFLLMDEPLASLDEKSKLEILPYLQRIHREFSCPILYVTHSMDEVMRLADQVLVMNQGKLVAQGNPVEVFSQVKPVLRGEAASVILQGRVVEHDERWHLARVKLSNGELWVRDTGSGQGEMLRVRVQARDVSLSLTPHTDTSILNCLPVDVVEIHDSEDQAVAQVLLKSGEEHLQARITQKSANQLGLVAGMSLWAQIKSAAVIR